MADNTASSYDWASSIGNLLNQVVDVGSQVAVANLANRQGVTTAQQTSTQVQTPTQAQAASTQANVQEPASIPQWAIYAGIGAAVLIGGLVLVSALRK